jgi:hypothetical protein
VVSCGLSLCDEDVSITGETGIAVFEKELLSNKQQPPAQQQRQQYRPLAPPPAPIPNITHSYLSAVSSPPATDTPTTSLRTSQRTRTRQRTASASPTPYLHDALQRKIGIPELPPFTSSLARKISIYASHDQQGDADRACARAGAGHASFFPPPPIESDSACVVCMLVLNMTRGCALRGLGGVCMCVCALGGGCRGCACCYYVGSRTVHFSRLPFRGATDRHMHAQKHAQRHAYLFV